MIGCSHARLIAVGAMLSLVGVVGEHVAMARPLRAHMEGKEIKGRGLFFARFHPGDERPGGQWLIDLGGTQQVLPIAGVSGKGEDATTGIYDLNSHLILLNCLENVNLTVSLRADSVGVDTLAWGGRNYRYPTRYEGDLVVAAAGRSKTVHLVMFCDTLIKVWGVFEIPGHPELIVLITYKRSGYCDEWDLPIVIPGM